MNFSQVFESAASGSTPQKRPTLTAANSTSPSSSSKFVPFSTAERSSCVSSSSLSSAPETSGNSKPAFAALLCSLSARQRAGSERATESIASAVVRWPFSCRLSLSQLTSTCSLSSARVFENTCGWRKMSFRTTWSVTSSVVKRPASSSMWMLKSTCISTSPSSSFISSGSSRSKASAASYASSRKLRRFDSCVCSRSHGHPPGARRMRRMSTRSSYV